VSRYETSTADGFTLAGTVSALNQAWDDPAIFSCDKGGFNGIKTGWWFGTFLMLPFIGNFIIPTDCHIFQEGQVYHQPEKNDLNIISPETGGSSWDFMVFEWDLLSNLMGKKNMEHPPFIAFFH
jgi:hypothetical protein